MSSDQNESNDNTQKSQEEDNLNVDQPNDRTDGKETVNEDNEENNEGKEGEKNSPENNVEEGNGNDNGNDVSNTEPSRNETTESADAELLGSSESEPLMFPHYSEQFNSHPDKPTVQCPECPQRFFYQGGLRHHMETHDRGRDIPTFQCRDCTDKFYYQSRLDHHYEMHIRQKRRESGLYSGDENNDTVENSEKKDIPQKGTKHSKKPNSKNATASKKKKKTINSDQVSPKGSGSIVSPSNAPTENEFNKF